MFLSKYTCDDCDKIYTNETVSSATTTTKITKNDNNRISIDQSSGIIQRSDIKLATAIRHHPSSSIEQQQHWQKSFESNHKRPYDSPDTTNSLDSKLQSTEKSEENSTQLLEFCRKYLGRRGRRKGSFHLKRDLVSYRTIIQQRSNLSQLNYQLIRPELKSLCATTIGQSSTSSSLPDSSEIVDTLDSAIESTDFQVVNNNNNKENNEDEHNSSCKRNKRRKQRKNLNRKTDVKNSTKLETDPNSCSSISVHIQNPSSTYLAPIVPESDNGDDEEIKEILSISSNHKTKLKKMRKVKLEKLKMFSFIIFFLCFSQANKL